MEAGVAVEKLSGVPPLTDATRSKRNIIQLSTSWRRRRL